MIWCVEDDPSIRDIEIYTLQFSGFKTKEFSNGLECWKALATEQPKLILLDVMLPEMDGITLLQKMRSNPSFKDIPVIMATAKGAEYDKIQGLDLGADDYLVKPFGMMEMLSRVNAVLRRYKPASTANILQLGQLILNIDTRKVTLDNQKIELTFKEFELLKLFLSNIDKVFTRNQLFSAIWGMDYCVESRTVDMHIRTLRQKLGKYGHKVQTVRNVGYRIEGDS